MQVFKNKRLTRTIVKNNILKVWEQAETSDKFDWYLDANIFAKELAYRYLPTDNLGVLKVCGVIAALSPMVRWETNKKLAETACKDEYIPCLQANASKAKKILLEGNSEETILSILRGNKTSSFFLNILYPDKAISLTIDRHALSIALGYSVNEQQHRSMTNKQYEFFSECYRWTAAKLDVSPLVLQSATWLVWRRIKKNK